MVYLAALRVSALRPRQYLQLSWKIAVKEIMMKAFDAE